MHAVGNCLQLAPLTHARCTELYLQLKLPNPPERCAKCVLENINPLAALLYTFHFVPQYKL